MKKKKILILGLPGSGKTYLASRFSKKINARWLNADKIRGKHNDWDFSYEGIIRQVNRMRQLADESKKKIVVADFVCPLKEQIDIFKPNLIVWMDTIKKGRFKSMNKMFDPPRKYHLRITQKNIKINLIKLNDKLVKYKWNDENPSGIMIGNYQSWHLNHRKTFEKLLSKIGQVIIFVKNKKKKPLSFIKVKKNIDNDLYNDYKNRYRIYRSPNITRVILNKTNKISTNLK